MCPYNKNVKKRVSRKRKLLEIGFFTNLSYIKYSSRKDLTKENMRRLVNFGNVERLFSDHLER